MSGLVMTRANVAKLRALPNPMSVKEMREWLWLLSRDKAEQFRIVTDLIRHANEDGMSIDDRVVCLYALDMLREELLHTPKGPTPVVHTSAGAVGTDDDSHARCDECGEYLGDYGCVTNGCGGGEDNGQD